MMQIVKYNHFRQKGTSHWVMESFGISFRSTILESVFFPPHLRLEHLGKPSSQRMQIL